MLKTMVAHFVSTSDLERMFESSTGRDFSFSDYYDDYYDNDTNIVDIHSEDGNTETIRYVLKWAKDEDGDYDDDEWYDETPSVTMILAYLAAEGKIPYGRFVISS